MRQIDVTVARIINPVAHCALPAVAGRLVGTVEVECAVTDDMMPGVVSLPHGYGHDRPGVRLSEATQLPGVSINDLTDPERTESIGANAVLNGIPVLVSSIPGE